MPRIKCDICGRWKSESRAHVCAPRFRPQPEPPAVEGPEYRPTITVWVLGLIGLAVMLGGLAAVLWSSR